MTSGEKQTAVDDQDAGTYLSLERVVDRLLSPDGCPWDREQTHQSLKRNLLEECYELMEAIDAGNPTHIAEELGDILLQVVFHIHIAHQDGEFEPRDVFNSINGKLIRRHPHVFGGIEVATSEDVRTNWEEIKQKERGNSSRLSSIPRDLPALAHAQLLQDRASLAGFDWDHLSGVLEKVKEEIEELKLAQNQQEKEWEFGDILLSVVNTARWINIQAEDSLRQANQRFRRRFMDMERLCIDRGLNFPELSIEDREALWQESKERVG